MGPTSAPQWRVYGRRALYTSNWVSLWLEEVEIPGEGRFEHHVIRAARPSVAVVVTDDANVLLLWRHRFITDRWGWEIPAGWVEQGEAPLDAARREVEEETGWRPGTMAELCSYHPLDGISDFRLTIYHATQAAHVGQPVDASESTRIEWLPLAGIARLIKDGLITDGPTLTGLSLVAAFPRLGGGLEAPAGPPRE